MSGAVLWAETPDEEHEEQPESEAHGQVDDSFAARRLRRWLRGMFGGKPPSGGKPPAAESDPDRERND